MHLPRNAQIWFPGYLKSHFRTIRQPAPKRVWLTIADHFEPLWNNASEETGAERVNAWVREWPRVASQSHDSAGRPPKYTFFFPQEQYRPYFLEPLAGFVRDGIGDVEVHIHHDGQGEQDFVDRMSRFTDTLFCNHGLLRKENGRVVFGFIHGDWALDNSRPDGRMCGLNNEIDLLVRLGCYADFTLPSAPEPAQTRTVNTIYWATDDALRPKSHDRGIPAFPGARQPPESLLMIPGPLAVRWPARGLRGRRLPRLETGELAIWDEPNEKRVALWLRFAPRLGDDVFVKLYTHGATEHNIEALFERNDLESALRLISDAARKQGFALHFVSAWEMRNAVNALIAGRNPVPALSADRSL